MPALVAEVSGTVCALCCARDWAASTEVSATQCLACCFGTEVKSWLVFGRRRERFQKLVDGAALHQIDFDQACEGERAGYDLDGVVSQPQQQEGNQGDRDLNANRGFRGSEEVADLQGLLDPAKEQLDRPAPAVEIGNLLRAGLKIIGEDAQHLAGLDRN